MKAGKQKNKKTKKQIIVMDKKKIVKDTMKYVKDKLVGESTGHDWWHHFRVWQLAKKINKNEGGNKFIIELSALIHDLADRKFNKGNYKKGVENVRKYLMIHKLNEKDIGKILYIIKYISFSTRQPKNKSLELKIVQDADRLDALGAIGVARTFAYGSKINRPLYNPEIKPIKNITQKHYLNNKSTSVNHFYEKLFLIKNLMNTKTGKRMAEKRHKFLEKYLKEFMDEWKG